MNIDNVQVSPEKLNEFNALRMRLAAQQRQYQQSYISMGDFTYGNPAIFYWGENAKLKIGKFCSIASNVKIFLGGNHNKSFCTTYPFNALMGSFSDIKGHPISNGDIIIGNDVWLAADSTIMSGVTIGDGAIIANKALVTKDVPPYSIVGGVPAKFIAKRFDQPTIDKFLRMKWWDWPDKHIVNAIRILQSNDVDGLYNYWAKYVNHR